MAHIFEDRVLETTTSTGTGTLALAGAVTGYRTFASQMATSDTCWYSIWGVDGSGVPTGEWEVGLGTYSATNTLTRTTVLESSNANALVTLSAGTKLVALTLAASRAAQLDHQLAINLPVTNAAGGVPATPAAGFMKLFVSSIAARLMPAWIGPSGLDTTAQPNLARNEVVRWTPAGNSTTITADGAAALTATGTATAANVAVTNRHTWQKRLDYLVTTAATTAVAGFRGTALQWGRGASAGDGGFHMVCRWGPATGVATTTSRAFVGMRGSTSAPTDVEPSSLTNIIGMGWDAADTNIQFMCNDGSGTATKIDLGASFPVPTADRTKAYEIAIFCPPNGSTVSYEVTDLATGAVAAGSVTTDMPANTQLLAPIGWMSVGGTSSVIGIALMSLYIESDY